MTIEEQFDKLRALQDVLSGKYALMREIEEMPRQLSAQEEVLARYKQQFVVINEKYEAVKARLAECKNELVVAEAAQEEAEKNMETAQSQREYEARDKEIHDATEKTQAARRDLTRSEQEAAELEERSRENEVLITTQEEDLTARRAEVKAAQAKKQKELDALEKKEATLGEGLDEELLFKFQRIIRNKGGRGIVAIKGGVCNGCHMILPAQFSNNVRMGEEIVFCPYCSRILYHEELAEGEEDFFDETTMGSLADLGDLDDDEADGEDEDEEIVSASAGGADFDE